MRDRDGILFERDGDVAIIRLNDPANLNALSVAMRHGLRTAVNRAAIEARAILLTGVGKAFCSGANLSEGSIDIRDSNRDAGALLEVTTNPLILALRDLPIPLVVAVRGAAAGAGCSLALCGDIILCSDTAYFLQAFRHVGLVPDGGSSYMLAKAVGRVRAMQVMLLGERLPAATALDWGLVTKVVPDDELDAEALKIARELAGGPSSLKLIRQQAWAALDAPLADQLDRERRNQRAAGQTNDYLEGLAAFGQKRRPSFTGR